MSEQFPAPSGVPPVPPAPPQTLPPVPQAPPGSYQVPVGGYGTPVGNYQVPEVGPKPSRRTGLFALLSALAAAIVAPVIAGIIALQIGLKVQLDQAITASGDVVLSALTPARTEVLWWEVTFWAATVLGLLALILGIIAIARRRGRGMGIFAVILAVLGPVGFTLLTGMMAAVGNGIALAEM